MPAVQIRTTYRLGLGKDASSSCPDLGCLKKGFWGDRALSFMYRAFSKDFSVYVIGRKDNLLPGCSTKDMAEDLARVLEKLKIPKVNVLGVSLGGMVAQHFAADYPDLIERLVLVATASRANPLLKKVVGDWLDMAEAGDFEKIFANSAEKMYSERRLKILRPFYRMFSKLGEPQDLSRFIIQGRASLNHDASGKLEEIQSPVLILGGGKDEVVGKKAAPEMFEKIPGSVLKIYPDLGHGFYEEAKDFIPTVWRFLKA